MLSLQVEIGLLTDRNVLLIESIRCALLPRTWREIGLFTDRNVLLIESIRCALLARTWMEIGHLTDQNVLLIKYTLMCDILCSRNIVDV